MAAGVYFLLGTTGIPEMAIQAFSGPPARIDERGSERMAKKEPGKGDGWKKAGLVGIGTVLGVLLAVNFSAIAQREPKTPIPYEDLQLLSAVFGKIKSD
ncbi:MAG: hypothetical protein ABI624_23445, partial [Casimicrobiaceae bacterium]